MYPISRILDRLCSEMTNQNNFDTVEFVNCETQLRECKNPIISVCGLGWRCVSSYLKVHEKIIHILVMEWQKGYFSISMIAIYFSFYPFVIFITLLNCILLDVDNKIQCYLDIWRPLFQWKCKNKSSMCCQLVSLWFRINTFPFHILASSISLCYKRLKYSTLFCHEFLSKRTNRKILQDHFDYDCDPHNGRSYYSYYHIILVESNP